MKKLNQNIFIGQEKHKVSATVSENGDAYFHNIEKSLLMPYRVEFGLGMWDMNYIAPEPDYFQYFIGSGYDATDWQNSAIDREVTK